MVGREGRAMMASVYTGRLWEGINGRFGGGDVEPGGNSGLYI